jgi:hypothetical protein
MLLFRNDLRIFVGAFHPRHPWPRDNDPVIGWETGFANRPLDHRLASLCRKRARFPVMVDECGLTGTDKSRKDRMKRPGQADKANLHIPNTTACPVPT